MSDPDPYSRITVQNVRSNKETITPHIAIGMKETEMM